MPCILFHFIQHLLRPCRTSRICCIMLFCGLLAANCYAKESRTTYQLNTDWAFFRGDVPHGEATDFNDRHWIPVVIPHIMQLEKNIVAEIPFTTA